MLSSNSNSNSSSSNNNPNYTLPFSENDITSFTSISEQDSIPNYYNSFLDFFFPNSPPHMHLDQFFHDHHHQLYNNSLNSTTTTTSTTPPPPPPPPPPPTADDMGGERCWKKKKKDRHSKINTAQGPRDRRMRLSLDIARRFFDLQDLLGYDKASRTVDWLLRASSSAIRELTLGSDDYYCAETTVSSSANNEDVNRKRKVVKKKQKQKQTQQRATVGKESRRKARDRARERTSQKRRLINAAAAILPITTDANYYANPNANVMRVEDLSSDETVRTMMSQPRTQLLCQWNSFNSHAASNAHHHLQDEQNVEFEFNGMPWEAYQL